VSKGINRISENVIYCRNGQLRASFSTTREDRCFAARQPRWRVTGTRCWATTTSCRAWSATARAVPSLTCPASTPKSPFSPTGSGTPRGRWAGVGRLENLTGADAVHGWICFWRESGHAGRWHAFDVEHGSEIWTLWNHLQNGRINVLVPCNRIWVRDAQTVWKWKQFSKIYYYIIPPDFTMFGEQRKFLNLLLEWTDYTWTKRS